jgi:Xaa-Pro aminopeptidase
MSHAKAEMRFSGERVRDAIPRQELERRWSSARMEMSRLGLDALVIQGMSAMCGGGGYFRWFTGQVPFGTYASSVVFPLAGPITLVRHGDADDSVDLDDADPSLPGIGRVFSTPHFPAVHYCGRFDAELLAGAVRDAGHRIVGLVGPQMMYHGFASALRELLADRELVDATDAIDGLKSIKSPYDRELARATAAMQDAVFESVRDTIRPGMKDFEVMAEADTVAQRLGGETGFFLGSSSPPDQAAVLRVRPQQGRTIEKGDTFIFQAENTGPGGFFSHMARIIVLGKAPRELRDGVRAMAEAQRFTASMLMPGAVCADVYHAFNAHMEARGFAPERRLYCHGQGYENVERPLIRDDESMKIAADMHIGIHPAAATTRIYATVCDNFLTRPDGPAARLHLTPQEVFEV